jgi:hypothetical protein
MRFAELTNEAMNGIIVSLIQEVYPESLFAMAEVAIAHKKLRELLLKLQDEVSDYYRHPNKEDLQVKLNWLLKIERLVIEIEGIKLQMLQKAGESDFIMEAVIGLIKNASDVLSNCHHNIGDL